MAEEKEVRPSQAADNSKLRRFLAYGKYVDELPAEDSRIKTQVLSKMASTTGTWQDRQVQLCFQSHAAVQSHAAFQSHAAVQSHAASVVDNECSPLCIPG